MQAPAEILEGQGWSVWWDQTILPGKRFEEEIQGALDQAKCVVVVWSKASVISDWVKDEIRRAKENGLLIPVLIEHVTIPLGSGSFQAADLSDWDGDTAHPEFQKMLTALTCILTDGAKTTDDPSHDIVARWPMITKDNVRECETYQNADLARCGKTHI